MLRHMYKSSDNLCLTQESDTVSVTQGAGVSSEIQSKIWPKPVLFTLPILHCKYQLQKIPLCASLQNVKETPFYSN